MPKPDVVAGVLRIPVTDLTHGDNARGELGDVTDLANSLRAVGQQQPLIVEPLEDGRWSVFDGNRRLKAAIQAGLTHVLALPRNNRMTDVQRILRQLGMHATAKGFDPIAEARAVEYLMFDDAGPHMDRAEIARHLSKSGAWVKGRIDLLQLAPDEQRSVAAGTLSVSEALIMVASRRNGALGGPQPRGRATSAVCTQCSRCGAPHQPHERRS